MSKLKTHAELEFKAAGWLDDNGEFKDDMQKAICNHVLDLLDVFSQEGHSGISAPYTIDLLKKLAKFEPITPLTGEDWEWDNCTTMGVGDGFDGVFQNKRCSSVFKDWKIFDGKPYYLNAIVFWEWNIDAETGEKYKSYFTNSKSRQNIEFPYIPHTKYVELVDVK